MEERDLFVERRKKLAALTERIEGKPNNEAPKGTSACPNCNTPVADKDLEANLGVCPHCGHHNTMSAKERIDHIFGNGQYLMLFDEITTVNPISFPGYEEKIASLKEATGINEACLAAVGAIDGIDAVAAALDSRFLMGSMGTAVGEKITLSVEYAESKGLPLIIFSASGGARMQEGIFSLMQMAKTASAVKHFSENGGLYISFLTHPTTGGVTASFASLGDIILAEPGALIGFAGPRVIEQTIKEKLPEGFQRSEFLLEHGFIDSIVTRGEMKGTLSNILRLHKNPYAAC